MLPAAESSQERRGHTPRVVSEPSMDSSVAGHPSATRRLALALAMTALAATGWAKDKRVAPDLNTDDPTAVVNVIVQYSHSPNSTNHGKAQKHGANVHGDFGVIKGSLISLPASEVKNLLKEDPDISFISPDRPVQGAATTGISLDYYPANINAGVAVSSFGLDGSGIAVAILDSGIHNVPDLNNAGKPGSRVVYQQSFVAGQTPDDSYGHGTHVAGIVAGNGSHSTGPSYSYTFKGIASNANLVNLRVLDQNGHGTDSAVISAIQTAINLKSQYNIRVINLSLGRQVFESYTVDPLCQAVEQAWKAGIVVVVAAGNQGRNNSAGTSGYGTIAAPGNDPYVITVGASNTRQSPYRSNETMTTYSSKGPTAYDEVVKPDLVAPGNRIISLAAAGGPAAATLVSAYPGNKPLHSLYITAGDNKPSNDYFMLSGTSMAAPVVSGAAALMLQQDPTLSPDTVKARLMKSAYKSLPPLTIYTDPVSGVTYTVQSDIFTIGAGLLDVQAALLDTDVVNEDLNANSPVAAYNSTTGKTYLVGGNSLVWGSSVVWGSSIVWGTSVVAGTSLVWGDSIVWGDSVVWGDSTNLGFSVVWGSAVVWGDSTTSDASVPANGDN